MASWWFQPTWNILVNIGIFPMFWGWKSKNMFQTKNKKKGHVGLSRWVFFENVYERMRKTPWLWGSRLLEVSGRLKLKFAACCRRIQIFPREPRNNHLQKCRKGKRISLSFLEGTNKRELTKFKTPSFLPNKNSSCLSKYCGWFRNLANQLRLVVYPIIYTEFYTSQVVV